jgi:hypothetical protein
METWGSLQHGQGTHCTKMDAGSLAKNTPNAPGFIYPICLPKPKVLDFNEKWLHWASVVHVFSPLKMKCQ